MPPVSDLNTSAPIDTRILLYRIARFAAFVALCAFVVKFFFFDTVLIHTDQMTPTLMDGDRVIIFKTFHSWPLSELFMPLRKSPVIFSNPQQNGRPSCLRVAALSGDSLVISSGKCIILNKRLMAFSTKASYEELLPPTYAPRDSMPLFRLPKKGASVFLDSLSLRDFFFFASLIRQENPKDLFSIKPSLFLDGTNADSLYLKDFYLYKGRLDSVPAKFQYDWFFWDRMRDYLSYSYKNKEVSLAFSLLQNDARIYNYELRNSCIFLIADDWQKGFDSRYFGPVLVSSVKGRVFCVLWSFGKDVVNKSYFRINRLFKIIR
jgi:signal peptidase I